VGSGSGFQHALLLAACVAGIVGMGMVFNGVMHGSLTEMSRGLAPLLIGGYWAGHQLGRSLLRSNGRSRGR